MFKLICLYLPLSHYEKVHISILLKIVLIWKTKYVKIYTAN